MDVKEMAALGGKARAEKLTAARRTEIAKIAGSAPRKKKKQLTPS